MSDLARARRGKPGPPRNSPPVRTLWELLDEIQPPGDPANYDYHAEIGCGSEGNVLSARRSGTNGPNRFAVKIVRISSPSIKKHVLAEQQIGLGVMRRIPEADEQPAERFIEHLVQFLDWYPGVGGV